MDIILHTRDTRLCKLMDTQARGMFQCIVFGVDASVGGDVSSRTDVAWTESQQYLDSVLYPCFHVLVLLHGLDCRMRSPRSDLVWISEIMCA